VSALDIAKALQGAVIFDSDLFQASGRPRCREGYFNRRINITLLYGSRH